MIDTTYEVMMMTMMMNHIQRKKRRKDQKETTNEMMIEMMTMTEVMMTIMKMTEIERHHIQGMMMTMMTNFIKEKIYDTYRINIAIHMTFYGRICRMYVR